MNQRDTKFVSRIIVLSMTSLVFSIGVRIVLENEQLTKLIPRSVAREFLLVFAPLVSLMVIHYTLAVKSFGMRSIQTEGLVYFFCASIFLTITLAYFFGQSVVLPPENCPWWQIRGCDGAIQRQASYFWSSPFTFFGLFALLLALRRERILPRG